MNGRLKVAHVATVAMSLRRLLLNQLRYLRDAGFEVVCVSAHGDDVGAVEEAGIRHFAAPLTRRFSPVGDLRGLAALTKIFRKERVGLVHTHTPKAGLLGQYAALAAGVRYRVHTIHGLYFPAGMKPSDRWRYVALERTTMRFSHMNLSQNPEDVATAVAEGICRPDRVEAIGNGIDLRRFDPDLYPHDRRNAVRASLGIDERRPVVGMVARFVAEKGYLELLKAARSVKAAVPDVCFLCAGPLEPDKRDGLSPEIITAMGLDGVVRFLGPHDDVADLYAAMDLLALPSHREGFPRAPMEAAAMGVPSVVTDIRGCRQTVDQGETGLLVPPRDVDALAAALVELLKDRPKREQFGRAARRKALAEFDEESVFARVAAAYERLTAERSVAHRAVGGIVGDARA